MKALPAAILVLAVFGTIAIAKSPGEITYEVTPDGSGFTFYQSGRRVAYSKAVDRTTRTLFVCGDRKSQPDIPILAVNDRMALWFNQASMPIEDDNKGGFVFVLRQQPTAKLAGKRFCLPHIQANEEGSRVR
jgi:hypothetical protein